MKWTAQNDSREIGKYLINRQTGRVLITPQMAKFFILKRQDKFCKIVIGVKCI